MSFIIRVKNNGVVNYLGPIATKPIAEAWVQTAKSYLALNYPNGEFSKARFVIIPLMAAYKSHSIQVLTVMEGGNNG